MKQFEISSQTNKKGRRKFKAILYKIYPDSCVDEANEVGTQYNRNGITWIREYCENALDSIEGMSIRCEFLDDERTELHGHGETGIEDGMMIFENAVMIGTFNKGYIDEVEDDNGEKITVCIGEGEIDAQCYHNFVTKLDEDLANGYTLNGSVEISHTDDNEGIVYKYGYKDKGRIPMIFKHSGYALLGVTPADDNAKLIELNKKHKEDVPTMNKEEIKALAAEIASAVKDSDAAINACKAECESLVAEANAAKDTVIAEKNELEATVEQLRAAIKALEDERDAKCKELEELWEERRALEAALGEAKAKERLGELENAISEFSDAEKEYASAEINAFKENPLESEVDTVVSKILTGIGKAAKAEQKKMIAEQNSQNDVDIFGNVESASEEDDSIF